MDETQLPSILSWLKGKFTSTPPEPQGQTYTASPRLNYPTDEDVDFARKNDYSYGQPWAPEFENKSARIQMGDPNTTPYEAMGIGKSGALGTTPPGSGQQDPLKNLYAKAALAVEGSSLAKLGFDPNKTAVDVLSDPKKYNIAIGGLYSPAKDKIYANAFYPSAVAHESIHRGIQKLQESPYWQPEFNDLMGGDGNEYLVRHLMEEKMGNPEVGFGDKQRDTARHLYNDSLLADKRRKLLSQMEEGAANYIAQRRPGGPR